MGTRGRMICVARTPPWWIVCRAVQRRNRVARIVRVSVGSGCLRLLTDQFAVAGRCVGVTVAGEVENFLLRPFERPLLLVAPAVVAHHEDSHRGVLVGSGLLAFEPIVEPTDLGGDQIEGGFRAEVDFIG